MNFHLALSDKNKDHLSDLLVNYLVEYSLVD